MPNELNQFCETIHVYERKKGHHGFSTALPYIVSSRINNQLAENLQKDNYPVILEGLHCTGVLGQIDMSNRKVIIRMHNEESIYYSELGRSSTSIFKKIYFYRESALIKKYIRTLPASSIYACVSESDKLALHEKYGLKDVRFLPIYPAWQKVIGEEGVGNLCLFHGNLSVPENEEAAIWLLDKVFSKINKPFVIAGKKPSDKLKKRAHLCQHTCLVSDPTDAELNDLIRKAHINILPCFNMNTTGIRLKLLHALFEGRHCVVNMPMVKGTGLEGACHIANGADAFASVVTQLYLKPFTDDEIRLRERLLGDTYNNRQNSLELIRWLY